MSRPPADRRSAPSRAAAGLLLACAGCAVPYRPLQAELPRPRGEAFDFVLDVVRVHYPRLILVDRDGFRIQSDWCDHDDERAGKKRASVYIDHGQLSVVVETRYLSINLAGEPSWSSPRGDPRLERQLLDAMLYALES